MRFSLCFRAVNKHLRHEATVTSELYEWCAQPPSICNLIGAFLERKREDVENDMQNAKINDTFLEICHLYLSDPAAVDDVGIQLGYRRGLDLPLPLSLTCTFTI